MGTQFGLSQRLLLAARPQDVEDGIGAGAMVGFCQSDGY
jgi:hypothetical protein